MLITWLTQEGSQNCDIKEVKHLAKGGLSTKAQTTLQQVSPTLSFPRIPSNRRYSEERTVNHIYTSAWIFSPYCSLILPWAGHRDWLSFQRKPIQINPVPKVLFHVAFSYPYTVWGDLACLLSASCPSQYTAFHSVWSNPTFYTTWLLNKLNSNAVFWDKRMGI